MGWVVDLWCFGRSWPTRTQETRYTLKEVENTERHDWFLIVTLTPSKNQARSFFINLVILRAIIGIEGQNFSGLDTPQQVAIVKPNFKNLISISICGLS